MNSSASLVTAQLVSNQRSFVGKNLLAELHTWEDVVAAQGKGWLIGYISYEQAIEWLQAPNTSVVHQPKNDLVLLPKVWFGLFADIETIDNEEISIHVRNGRDRSVRASQNWTPNITQAEYIQKFNALHGHIQAGDIYQANLSYRLQQPANTNDADLFAQLYAKQPANYSAYLSTPDWSVMSFSPERLCSVEKGVITSEPMKGTRPRGETIPADAVGTSRDLSLHSKNDTELYQELLHSEKDLAELNMITDIHRNDLARVSEPGSVTVTNPHHIQALPTVWQASSVIQSRLASSMQASDVLQAMAPAGSITGAPKLRAAELLHELEPTWRNVYCGSIGYIDPAGNADFSVAIRTMYRLSNASPDMWYYHVGSGLVFDSTAEAEYQETLAKLRFLHE